MTISRFTPLLLKNNQQLANRVVIPPMASSTANGQGEVTQSTIDHYQKLSQSQAAMVIVEYTFIHLSGRSEENQLGIDNDAKIPGLSQIANLLHEAGAIAGIQLTHSGGKTQRQLTNGRLMTPSGISVPVKGQELDPGDAMNIDDITQWQHWFLAAANRAYQAGFDLVELHAAHGYGLNQYLSPLTNQRNDKYGGSLSHRIRLLREIIHEIKSAYHTKLLSVRMPGQDFMVGGMDQHESQELARILQRDGVDILNISSGIGGWRRPTSRFGQGYLTEESKLIQSVVNIPVIGVGGIETGKFIDQALQQRRFSLAAVGRAILATPKTWGELQLNDGRDKCAYLEILR